MKEVLTKGFWRGVVKNFYEGLEGVPAKTQPPQANDDKPPAAPPNDAPSAADTKSSPPTA